MIDKTTAPLPTFSVRTICGSMRYYAEMLVVAEELTAAGCIVLMPFVANYAGGYTADEHKLMLDAMHRAKIDMSGGIVVVGSHIGESTRSEINYAVLMGKAIDYVEVS